MAVAEMVKLNLAGMSYEKDALLNALQRTGATEIKMHYEAENTSALTADCENLRLNLAKTDTALERLSFAVNVYVKENKIKADDELKDGFEVSYSQFMSAKDMADDMSGLVNKIDSIYAKEKELASELNKLRRTVSSAEIYSLLDYPLDIRGTEHTEFRLGTLPEKAVANLSDSELFTFKTLSGRGGERLIFAAYHKSAAQDTEKLLQEAGFSVCPFNDGCTGRDFYKALTERITEIKKEIVLNAENAYSLKDRIRDMKIYSDYLSFELEKAELSEKLRATLTTFLLEAYVPKECEEKIKNAVEEVSDAVYFEFSSPAEDEIPPTLLKNNKVVKNFEAVTNMYSPVRYGEFDPNAIMAFFYSVFLGFIMGDVGYGLLMTILGGFVYFRTNRDTGMKRLAGVFAVGGIFAVIWGFLFNSLFGLPLFKSAVMPDAQGDMWSLTGIKIPAVLIISLLIGTVQLCAGYICKAVQCWRRGKILDGIFDGVVWALFTAGVGLAVVGLIDDFKLTVLAYAGGITAGAMLLTAMLTAGRKEKILGKFTKGFGAAYGVINFASDVLSYARLYGLMLSGAVIAQIISGYAVTGMNGGVGMLFSGNAGLVILGVVLMFIGHAFNLAIGLLGAYIHDARLQYVEFYGRFYEGEGELFAPLGSKHKYIYLNG